MAGTLRHSRIGLMAHQYRRQKSIRKRLEGKFTNCEQVQKRRAAAQLSLESNSKVKKYSANGTAAGYRWQCGDAASSTNLHSVIKKACLLSAIMTPTMPGHSLCRRASLFKLQERHFFILAGETLLTQSNENRARAPGQKPEGLPLG